MLSKVKLYGDLADFVGHKQFEFHFSVKLTLSLSLKKMAVFSTGFMKSHLCYLGVEVGG